MTHTDPPEGAELLLAMRHLRAAPARAQRDNLPGLPVGLLAGPPQKR